MGYWVVIAMVLVAVIAVLYAVLAESESHPDHVRPGADTPLVVLMGTRAIDGSAEVHSPPWPERVRTALTGAVEVYDATVPSARVSDYHGADLVAIFRPPPAVAVIWLGIDDFLLGTELGTFERGLGHLLSSLAAERISLVTLALPDLASLLAEDGATPEDIVAARAEIRRWNATITRLATAYHARLLTTADLLSGIEAPRLIRTQEQGGWFLSEAGNEAVATAVASVITDALAAQRSGATIQPTA
jgi:hypothetical protein